MNRTRPDWMYRQSAVIPYRHGDDGLEILLITSRKRRRWVPPKGVVEPNMSPPQSAAQEALEEAGIRGTVDEIPLGTYSYEKWGRLRCAGLRHEGHRRVGRLAGIHFSHA